MKILLIILIALVTMTSCGKTTEPANANKPQIQSPSVTITEVTFDSPIETSPVETSSVESSKLAETTKPVETQPVETSKSEESIKPVETTTQHTHNWQPVYKTVHHDAEYKTVHHEAETHVEHHDAEYKTVYHDAEYDEVKTLVGYRVKDWAAKFSADGYIFDPYDYNYNIDLYRQARTKHQDELRAAGLPNNYSNEIVYHDLSVEEYNRISWEFRKVEEIYDTVRTLVRDAWEETVLVRDAWDETIVDKKAYDEKVLIKEAYDEEVIDYYQCDCGELK